MVGVNSKVAVTPVGFQWCGRRRRTRMRSSVRSEIVVMGVRSEEVEMIVDQVTKKAKKSSVGEG